MDSTEEKRMAGEYEIIKEIYIGDREVVLGVNEKSEMPYFCALCENIDIFQHYTECVTSKEYAEIVELYADRIKSQCEKLREQQKKMTVPREPIPPDMCQSISGVDLTGKVVAVRLEVLRPEYRSAAYQLIYVTGGNGAKADARGRACFYTNLYSGKHGRWERYDIQGEVKPECLPKWAKDRLNEIQSNRAKNDQNRELSAHR